MQPPRAAWTPPATLPPGRREIQPLEYQRQLRGRHRSALRQVEPAALQALVPDPKPGLVPQQQLHPVPPPIAEHEQLTRQRIGAQPLAHQRLQPVERPPHVHRLAIDRDPQTRRQHQHPDVSRTDSKRARAEGSKPCGTHSASPSGHRSSNETPSSLGCGTLAGAVQRSQLAASTEIGASGALPEASPGPRRQRHHEKVDTRRSRSAQNAPTL